VDILVSGRRADRARSLAHFSDRDHSRIDPGRDPRSVRDVFVSGRDGAASALAARGQSEAGAIEPGLATS
jgi:hypothetical protein